MTTLEAIGWCGNGFYFARFALQWWLSERAKKSVAPPIFWWLSLAGASALGGYAFSTGDAPLFLGYGLTFMIYLRNLSIVHMGARAGRVGTLPALVLGAVACGVIVWAGALPRDEAALPMAWIALAFAGQAIFSMRFVVQWFASERAGNSHFPRSFWWLSLIGNLALLAYAIRRGDPVFIAGFALGPFVQIRNLMLADDDQGPEAAIPLENG